MNVYLVGMVVAMVVFATIGFIISRRIKNVEDFYVAGRQAPVLLIAGSLIASYSSTGLFMGDAGQCYSGALSAYAILAGIQSAGYIIGAVFFGRYLRRSKALTIPEFFGKRFHSETMRTLSAVIAIITMMVYLLSIVQGIGTLMAIVTNIDYRICVVLSTIVFTLISVTSGSRGVLITDTLMAAIFTGALILGVLFIARNSGGWYGALGQLAADPNTRDLLAWTGRAGVLYDTGWENMIWGINFGLVWMGVCMIGPWQSSRYQMARDEHTVVRSSYWAAAGVFLLQFLSAIGAVMVRVAMPEMADSSHVLIWAAMNLMPTFLGVVLLTGILSAGISSATTFQSLVGASIANDIFKTDRNADLSDVNNSRSIRIGRYAMVVAALMVTVLAVLNPPAIFVIMFLGGAIIASSWMPVALGCILSKRLTKVGAFLGMLLGFLTCFVLKLVVSLSGITLPAYLDPSIIGVVVNLIAMIIASACTQVSNQEKAARAALFVIPEGEKDPVEIKKTLWQTRVAMGIGVLFTVGMIALWIVPYYKGLGLL